MSDQGAWEDPAETTEKRDWELPATVHDEHGQPGGERPAQGGPGASPDEPPPATGAGHRRPADESEKRDWEI